MNKPTQSDDGRKQERKDRKRRKFDDEVARQVAEHLAAHQSQRQHGGSSSSSSYQHNIDTPSRKQKKKGGKVLVTPNQPLNPLMQAELDKDDDPSSQEGSPEKQSRNVAEDYEDDDDDDDNDFNKGDEGEEEEEDNNGEEVEEDNRGGANRRRRRDSVNNGSDMADDEPSDEEGGDLFDIGNESNEEKEDGEDVAPQAFMLRAFNGLTSPGASASYTSGLAGVDCPNNACLTCVANEKSMRKMRTNNKDLKKMLSGVVGTLRVLNQHRATQSLLVATYGKKKIMTAQYNGQLESVTSLAVNPKNDWWALSYHPDDNVDAAFGGESGVSGSTGFPISSKPLADEARMLDLLCAYKNYESLKEHGKIGLKGDFNKLTKRNINDPNRYGFSLMRMIQASPLLRSMSSKQVTSLIERGENSSPILHSMIYNIVELGLEKTCLYKTPEQELDILTCLKNKKKRQQQQQRKNR
jgi:hypothetical protein